MSWRDAAACLAVDNELFFPIGTVGPALAQVAEAKAVCQRCAVREPCLRWALDTRQDHGIWGGLTETERRLLRRSGVADEPAALTAAPVPRATVGR